MIFYKIYRFRFLKYFKTNTLRKWQKQNLLKEVFRGFKSSDDEFYSNSFNTDFDKAAENICSENISSSDSDSDVVPVKRSVIQLDTRFAFYISGLENKNKY